MFASTQLNHIFKLFNILGLEHGVLGDKLGDVFESYSISIFNNEKYLTAFNSNSAITGDYEFDIFNKTLNKILLPPKVTINKISAHDNVQKRLTRGSAKTDIILDLHLSNQTNLEYPISIKQTTAPLVAFAEFDVNTIVNEIGITDSKLIYLMTKHQTDASAKNFSSAEKSLLISLLEPIKFNFVKWVATGSTTNSVSLQIPKLIIKYKLSKEKNYEISKYDVFTTDEYVNHILFNKYNLPKKGGFGTGLSWTYATGTKYKKIQFKG
jgi:hypothetical protein